MNKYCGVLLFDEKKGKWNCTDKYIQKIKDSQDKMLKRVGVKEE